MIVIAVIDVFHRRKKTGAVYAVLPKIALNRLKRKADILIAAMHVGVDNFHDLKDICRCAVPAWTRQNDPMKA
jgi:hypothetical protein